MPRRNWSDTILVFYSSLLLPAVEYWLRRRGFRRCYRSLERLAGGYGHGNRGRGLEYAERIARLVDRSNRLYSIYPADCLARSLVVWWLLNRRGLPVALRFGVRTITGQFEAHAWVEHEGTPVNEPEAVQTIYAHMDWEPIHRTLTS